MRTTVELTDEQRAKLLEIAARRGEKGFSGLVQEAIDRYLREETAAARRARVKGALDVLGTLNEDEAEALSAHVQDTRSRWR